MDDLVLREDIRKTLDTIHRDMTKQDPHNRAAFLSSKIEQWDQKIQNDSLLFKNLLANGELNIDPETFETELDEERWAMGILRLWMLELESSADSEREILTQREDIPDDKGDSVEDPPAEIRQDGLWNIKQVAKYLNLSVDYLYKLTRKEEILLIKMGKECCFGRKKLTSGFRRGIVSGQR